MTDEEARARKKRLKAAFKEAGRRREIASSPVPLAQLEVLLDAVTRLVFDGQGRNLCDHTHRCTRLSLRDRCSGDIDEVLSFLRDKGCFCDCEVALTLGSWLEENRPSRETRH